jgi:exodeoxyribonuclease VII small subunit
LKSSKKVKSFEECFSRLEKILERLESEEVTLDETIKLYEEGLSLTKSWYDMLSKAGLSIKEINKTFKGDIEIKEYKQQ